MLALSLALAMFVLVVDTTLTASAGS